MPLRVVLLDFDGTLAFREGLWGGCVIEVLDELMPAHEVSLDQVRVGLRDGFPWHRHDEPHPHLSDADSWWEPIEALIGAALLEAGIEAAGAARAARAVRLRYCDPSRGWQLFEDSLAALERLRRAGWRCAVLSNHIPELSTLVEGLGLHRHLDGVFSSAVIGYEKPHPEAFRLALRAMGDPGEVWMVGDNPVADVAGAEALGIPAILVRRSGDARRTASDLERAARLILGSAGRGRVRPRRSPEPERGTRPRPGGGGGRVARPG